MSRWIESVPTGLECVPAPGVPGTSEHLSPGRLSVPVLAPSLAQSRLPAPCRTAWGNSQGRQEPITESAHLPGTSVSTFSADRRLRA